MGVIFNKNFKLILIILGSIWDHLEVFLGSFFSKILNLLIRYLEHFEKNDPQNDSVIIQNQLVIFVKNNLQKKLKMIYSFNLVS